MKTIIKLLLLLAVLTGTTASAATSRINAISGTTTTPVADDYIAVDGTTNGTTKMLANLLLLKSGGTMTGNLLFTDATYDIGASGATRPRDLFLSRNLTLAGAIAGANSVTAAASTDLTLAGGSGTTKALFTTPISVGNSGTELTGAGYFRATSGFAKTDTALRNVAAFSTNEAAGSSFKLLLSVTGNATATSRIIDLQTSNEGVSNSGILSFQGLGGNLSLGTTTSVATVNGTTTATTSAGALKVGSGISTDYVNIGGGKIFTGSDATVGGNLTVSGTGTSAFSGLVTAPRYNLTGNVSAAAWTTSGIGLTNSARTLTDTSSSGTVAAAYTNVLGGNTIAASSSTTFTDYATLHLSTPSAGSNVTITNPYSLITAGNVKVGGTLTPSGRVNLPMGEINYFNLTGTTVSIASQSTTGTNNAVKAAPTTALTTGQYEFDNGGADNGRLRYTGATTRMFHVAGSVSFSGGANDTFTIMFAKNGSVVTTSTIGERKMGAGGDVGSTAIHGFIELATNDYIEIFFANITNADDPTVHSLNIFAMGM